MTKPMTDKRLAEIETDSVNLHNHALRQELVDEIRRLREENERLVKKTAMETAAHAAPLIELVERLKAKNAKLRKVADAGRESVDILLDTLKALKEARRKQPLAFDGVLEKMAKLDKAIRELDEGGEK